MKEPLGGSMWYSFIILAFIGIILLLPTVVFSIPLWSSPSVTPSSPQSYLWSVLSTGTFIRTYNFTINWTDSITGMGGISNVTFESNFSTVLRNYTIGINITGNNNTQGIWWVNLTQTDIPAGTFVYRWYAKNVTDTDYTNSSTQLSYTVNKRTICSLDVYGGNDVVYPIESNVTYGEGSQGDTDIILMMWRNNVNIKNASGDIGVISDALRLSAGSYSYLLNRTTGQNYTAVGLCDASDLQFSVSKGNHIITILLNGSSSNQTYEKGSIANITIVSNATIDNITSSMTIYTNFTGTNQSISSLSTSILNSLYNLTDTSNLALGTYIISSNASETANYSSSSNSSLILTVVDTTPPTIRLYDYSNATFKKSGNSLTLNISVSDNSILNDNCTVRIANSSTASSITGITNANSGWCNGTIIIPSDIGSDGNKTINITFYDGNNTGVNSSYVLQLDNTAPTISIYENGIAFSNASSKIPGNSITLNISVSDAGSGATGNCYIYINETNATVNGIPYSSGWCNGTATVPSASTFPVDGNYTLKVNVSDSVGNTGTNSSFVISIDRTAPTVSISVSPTTAYVYDTIQISASASDASGIASQSVTVTKPSGASISVGGTYTPDQPGTYTASITATDNAGNSASASTTFTIYQYSSSLPPPSAPTKTSTFTRISPGETKTMAVDEKIGITQIEISVKSIASDVTITVKKLDKKPDYITVVSGKLYRYFEITHQNIQDKLEKAKIRFKVDKTWIISNNIDESTIALNRYADNKWNKLTASKTSEDTNYTYFEAESTALSVFAITGEEKIILIPPKERPVENITKPEEKLPELPKVEEKKPIKIIPLVASFGFILILLLVLFAIKRMGRKNVEIRNRK